MSGKMVSVEETAGRIGVSVFTVRAWIRERRLPFFKLGRRVLLAEEDIENLLSQSRVEPLKQN